MARKYETAKTLVPHPVIESDEKNDLAILAYGSSDPAIQEARHLLKTRKDIEVNYLRLRALPLTDSVGEFLRNNETIYVVEQNRDAQVAAILREHYPEYATHIQSILHYNGMPIDAETIVSKLLALLS